MHDRDQIVGERCLEYEQRKKNTGGRIITKATVADGDDAAMFVAAMRFSPPNKAESDRRKAAGDSPSNYWEGERRRMHQILLD